MYIYIYIYKHDLRYLDTFGLLPGPMIPSSSSLLLAWRSDVWEQCLNLCLDKVSNDMPNIYSTSVFSNMCLRHVGSILSNSMVMNAGR